MPAAGANFEVILQQELQHNKALTLNVALRFVSDLLKLFWLELLSLVVSCLLPCRAHMINPMSVSGSKECCKCTRSAQEVGWETTDAADTLSCAHTQIRFQG